MGILKERNYIGEGEKERGAFSFQIVAAFSLHLCNYIHHTPHLGVLK